MPELPEVETTRIGIAPYLLGETISNIIVRNYQLRWPISKTITKNLPGQEIRQVKRRGKYIIIKTNEAAIILHLGMSGHLRILLEPKKIQKHDHVDLELSSGTILRFNDPRRFGCLIYTKRDPLKHDLIKSLGPEPLEDDFTAEYLYEKSRNRKTFVKTFIMDSKVVVGVGNIYASESLFQAGILPKRKANKISFERYEKLVAEIKAVLKLALQKGGTTLRDFTNSDGKPGYFRHELNVYDRAEEPCKKCGNPIQIIQLGQRSTYYCTHCQH